MRRLRMSLVQPQSFICKIQGPMFSERITKSGKDVPEMGVFHGARGPIRSLSDPASIYVNTSAQTVRYPEHSDGLLKFGIFVASGRLYRARSCS